MNSKSYAKNQGSIPYNPQQNGIAEWNNRTLMEVARAMLHDQDIPMHLSAEDSITSVYVQNRTPHRVLENKTLEEVFSSKKLDSAISEYSAVQCTYTFQKKREQN